MRKAFSLLLVGVFLAVLALLFAWFHFRSAFNPLDKVQKWFILLGYDPSRTSVTAADVAGYDMAILDPDSHPELGLFDSRTILIGYVSVGEAETYRAYWQKIKDRSWVLEENPNWGGNYFVDVRNPEWRSILIREVIPALTAQGFKGVFLDTLDTAEYLESLSPEKFGGSKQAMADLVRLIRQNYPDLLLISNNGFAILDEIAPYLDGLLAESVLSMPDFEKGGYRPVPEEDRAYKLKYLKDASAARRLPVFIIDYASKTDPVGRAQIARQLWQMGFRPYVAEKNLSELS